MALANTKEILCLMSDGWQLGLDTSTGRPWLQKDGCGIGGETKQVHTSTFLSLRKKKLIISNGYHFPLETYRLAALASLEEENVGTS